MTDDSIVDLAQQGAHQGVPASPQDINPPEAEDASLLRKAEAMSSSMPVDRNIEATLNALLKNVKNKMTWVEIDLPSQGILYESGISKIKIKPFTYKDERDLKSVQNATNPEGLLETLLRNCISGITVEELTPIDRVYVLFRIRGISYGDDYAIQHSCDSCGADNKLSLKISTLKTTPLREEDMRFRLPDSKMDCEVTYPRSRDEDLYSTSEKLMDNMHRFIRHVGGVKDSLIVEQFVRSTTVRDIDTIRTKIFNPNYGMETDFFYNCGECGVRSQVDINLNPTFFTAS